MRKLQDLVPNMDKVSNTLKKSAKLPVKRPCYLIALLAKKFTTLVSLQQTNTADMLDLAVEYIKDLQKKVEVIFNFRLVIEI